MTPRHSRPHPSPDIDYQQHEAEYFARHARPADVYDPDFQRWRHDHLQAMDEDYRTWRQDRRQRFGEAFDRWRAERPARSPATGSHHAPPSEGTDPGQRYSASPGASGKNK
jgi:hypothetical protein